RLGVVFLARDVVLRLLQQLQRVVQATRAVDVGVLVRTVAEVLAVFGGGDLGLLDRAVGLDDRDVFLRADGGVACAVLQVPARVAQVGERVQVGGVLAGQVGGVGRQRRERGAQGERGEDGVRELAGHGVSFRWVVVRVCVVRLQTT